MADQNSSNVGKIGWVDLTVKDAGLIRYFYQEVVGWTSTALDMGGYSDYVMNEPEGGSAVSGICHARGINASMPPAWLIYVTVADLDKSIGKCHELGGEVIAPTREYGSQGRYCVIRDPAGAIFALYEEKLGKVE